jgi:hypothetical protein
MQKSAAPYVVGVSPESASLSDLLKSEALRRALKAGVFGLGTGALAGLTLTGLSSLLTKKTQPKSPNDAIEVDVPYQRRKAADWADSTVAALGPTPAGSPAPTLGSLRWFRDGGVGNTSVSGIPWAIPAAVGAGAAGLVGGHQLVRWLLHKRYKADLDRQLQQAQKEYDEALSSKLDATKVKPLLRKDAAESTSTLDLVFDAIEKSALFGLPSLDELAGTGAGLYLTGAGALGLGAALGSAKYFGDFSKTKALKDALRRRAIIRELRGPASVRVRPVPVDDDN